MAAHEHSDGPWRVRVECERFAARGAGVLLSDRLVVTCAHLLGQDGGQPPTVRVESTVCRPEWSRTARVVSGTWVYRGSRRGDVALLELDEPTPCGTSATLWCAPLSGGQVRAYGFPGPEPYGINVDAALAGVGGREGEWGTLYPVRPGAQWIEPGFSGAGVLALDGEFAGRVLGIVVRDYVNGDSQAAWMLPTETMLGHIPQLLPFVRGEHAFPVPGQRNERPWDGAGEPEDPGALALARELAELLRGTWSGTVVLTGGSTTGTGWLTSLLLTADPRARAKSSEQTSAARHGAVLDFGSVDAAFDADGRTAAEVRKYLADRFGFPDTDDLASRLLHRKPPVRLAISSVDRCREPETLVGSLLLDLAREARWRDIRLVLGFDREPPSELAYEVSLGPVGGSTLPAGPQASKREAEEAIWALRGAEADAATRYRDWELRFFAPPKLPRRGAPQAAVRCEVAGGIADEQQRGREYAAIRDGAAAALEEVERFCRAMERRIGRWQDHGRTLEMYRERAQRVLDAEDPELTRLYSRALRSLRRVPIDLGPARTEVARFAEAVNRRIEQVRAEHGPRPGGGGEDDGGDGDAV